MRVLGLDGSGGNQDRGLSSSAVVFPALLTITKNVLAGDGTNVAYRARCRPPSFIHFSLFPHLIRGHTLSDIVAVLGSLNIIAAELDR